MDDGKKVVDLSSFMLFEATGDSEPDSELNKAVVDAEMIVAEDDAQSCSCDTLDYGRIIELGELDDLRDAHDEDFDVTVDDDDEEEEEEEATRQDWTGDDEEVVLSSTAKAGQRKKSKVCVDSTMELMNEREKSRLFWEACLAS